MYAPSGHKDLLHLQLDYKQMSGMVSQADMGKLYTVIFTSKVLHVRA